MNRQKTLINTLRFNRGIVLIMALILLMVLASLSLLISSITTTNNKASRFNSAKMEAQQKADTIAKYVVNRLQNLPSSSTISNCAMAKSCNLDNYQVWNVSADSISPSPYLTTANTTTKTWWRTNAQDYPNAIELQSFATYFSQTDPGSRINDPVASFIVTQESDNGVIKSLKIIAYATDSTGQTAAVKQVLYPLPYYLTPFFLTGLDPTYLKYGTTYLEPGTVASSNGNYALMFNHPTGNGQWGDRMSDISGCGSQWCGHTMSHPLWFAIKLTVPSAIHHYWISSNSNETLNRRAPYSWTLYLLTAAQYNALANTATVSPNTTGWTVIDTVNAHGPWTPSMNLVHFTPADTISTGEYLALIITQTNDTEWGICEITQFVAK